MRDRRFSIITSYVILGALVVGGSGVIWFAVQAYSEIDQIASTMPVYEESRKGVQKHKNTSYDR